MRITLLDVVGKVVERLLQDRLQLVAEMVLPEFHCGFQREGMHRHDFAVRQLVEKAESTLTSCLSSS